MYDLRQLQPCHPAVKKNSKAIVETFFGCVSQNEDVIKKEIREVKKIYFDTPCTAVLTADLPSSINRIIAVVVGDAVLLSLGCCDVRSSRLTESTLAFNVKLNFFVDCSSCTNIAFAVVFSRLRPDSSFRFTLRF